MSDRLEEIKASNEELSWCVAEIEQLRRQNSDMEDALRHRQHEARTLNSKIERLRKMECNQNEYYRLKRKADALDALIAQLNKCPSGITGCLFWEILEKYDIEPH